MTDPPEPAATPSTHGRLGSRTWTEVAALDLRPVLVVPLGSLEQHGPHLPLDTDTRIAVTLAERVAAGRPDLAVAPALSYGASGEHAAFPGTVSIGNDALEQVLVELVRSADAFGGAVVVNGHGGNAGALQRVETRCAAEGRRVLAWSWTLPGADAHAGRTETSLLLAIAPDLVRLDRAEAGSTEPLDDLLPRLRSAGVDSVSPNGVLGDPTGASVAEGRELLARLVADLAAAVDTAFRPGS
jgi:creatinine amidohydrolase